MRILLSNDDGIDAPGLAALREAVGDMGEVHIVAPDTQQSAVGHGITLRERLEVRAVRLAGDVEAVSVAGRPADCVRLAIRRLLPAPPDLVLAGINLGSNVGVNVFYSGTVAAAAEGAMMGVPAVAFSVGSEPAPDFARCGAICRRVLDDLLTGGLGAGDLVNVNVPTLTADRPRGVRVVPQSTAELSDAYYAERDGAGNESYRLSKDYEFAHQPDTDVEAILDGYVSVTPLHVDMTNHDRMLGLGRIRWELGTEE